MKNVVCNALVLDEHPLVSFNIPMKRSSTHTHTLQTRSPMPLNLRDSLLNFTSEIFHVWQNLLPNNLSLERLLNGSSGYQMTTE